MFWSILCFFHVNKSLVNWQLGTRAFWLYSRKLGTTAFQSIGSMRVLRWKTERKKIHRLAYRFSIDFKIYRLAYGFLCVNHKGLAKVSRFLVRTFFSRDFKNPYAGMDFPMDFWLFWICFISDSFWFVQILTLLNVAPPPCNCTLCCDIMLVTDIPYNVVNCGHGPYSPPESRRKRQTKKLKLGLKYMCYNVHCMFIGTYI